MRQGLILAMIQAEGVNNMQIFWHFYVYVHACMYLVAFQVMQMGDLNLILWDLDHMQPSLRLWS